MLLFVSWRSPVRLVTNPLHVIIACTRHGVKPSSGKALLLFLVTCMHDAMQATCMLCAVWRTRDTVICGTEWFEMHDWMFWKVCERTRNSETLPDLESCLYKAWSCCWSRERKEKRNQKRSEWENIRESRKKKRVRLRACAVNCDRAIAIFEHLEVVVYSTKIYCGTERNS